jgi:hypothetical protein
VSRDLTAPALDAACRGWRVFPLCPGRKRPRAAAADWETRATTDPDRIGRWWTRHPADNVGIATGPSGLVVLDLDTARPDDTPPAEWPDAGSGLDVLAALGLRHGHAFARTWTVATPSGGRHLYYRHPTSGPELRNTAGRLGWKIDTRAHGGYVVAAGSTVDGRDYVTTDDTDPIELPGWLARLLAPPPAPRSARPSTRSRARGYVQAALAGEVQRVLDAPEGTRNRALNAAAWNLGRHVAAGALPREVAETALCEAGIAAGYRDGPRAVAAVVRAGLDARLRRGVAS